VKLPIFNTATEKEAYKVTPLRMAPDINHFSLTKAVKLVYKTYFQQKPGLDQFSSIYFTQQYTLSSFAMSSPLS